MQLTRQQYIAAIAQDMVGVCKGTGLFPSIMIAQGSLESANGNSVLAHEYHNHFGMKPGSTWHGPTINMGTTEWIHGKPERVSDYFRVYNDFAECAKDHVAMLQRVPIYKTCGLFKATTPEAQAAALLKAGYATDPNYAKSLVAIINECNLKQYDTVG